MLVTWFAGKLGYTMGSKYLTKLNGGMMDKLMYVCGIVGLMVIGAMVASMVGLTHPHYLRKHRSGAAGCAEHHSAEHSESWHRNADVHPDPQKVKTGWLLGICIVGGVAINALGLLV